MPNVVAASSILAIFGIALTLLFTATPSTLSNRGNIWTSALAALEGQYAFGLGLDRWEPLTQLGYLPEHFPHNGYLLILFSGGVVALLLFFAFLVQVAPVGG